MSQPERTKFALADYTVELRTRGWYFGRQHDAGTDYRGPYASIASVTLMIARQFQREIERRHRVAVSSAEDHVAGPT